ncbi:CyP450 monooxygenase [Lentinus tigrinus ALCF2SS1-7]|uniref:CyP450 monooxygenase n=1 Tax=Lentinus tigrinus ALCF2SS1-6 TaxID=1328759 RepID=A0A5C2S1C5_9APHY|nr:CyP450 monooxygenase [Lentinus tigrinus ALCF2SS1-6]RPD73145.1 CyP450 monooxygenase [Lentinus tigrinus ALCF2SS1-7]
MSISASSLVFAALVTVILGFVRSRMRWNSRTRGRSLPPGPKGLSFFGNVLDLRTGRPWVVFNELREKYGPILYFEAFRQPIVVLGSPDTVLDFLDRRSANTSDRKQTPSIALTGHEWALGLLPYGPAWRRQRRIFWQHFHPGAIEKYRPVQLSAVHTFLARVASDPDHLDEHIQYTFTAAVLKMAYGIDVKDENDEMLAFIEAGLQGTRELIVSGGFLVDYFPFLRHMPSFFPGCGFHKLFAKWRKDNKLLREMPFMRYKDAVSRDKAPACILSEVVSSADENGKESKSDLEEVGNDVMSSVFEAGSDTTASVLKTFCLAMSLYPDVQKKAHAELDAVVGHDRLPDFSDRESLTYLNAVIKESLRWMNVTPLGLAHCTTEDDEFGGYFIPADSIVMANIWACMHDPETYEDPDAFRPERFIRDGTLNSDVRDPYEFVFGFGRRICPGRYFGDAALFINAAALLHVFDITPPVDADGKQVKIEPRMVDCVVSRPEDSWCNIKARGPWAEALIRSTQRDSIS